MNNPIADYAHLTLAAYRRYANHAIANWSRYRKPSRFLRRFAKRLPRGSTVLDYGCGIGTDMAWMQRQGLSVEGIDGTEEFVRQARQRCPTAHVKLALFETVKLPKNHYDAIWSQASLLHVPPSILSKQLRKLRGGLKPNGLLGISLAWGRLQGLTKQDWVPGRYVAGYSKSQAVAFLEDWRLEEVNVVSHDARHGRWIQILAVAKQ